MSKRRDDDRNRPNFLVAANRDNSAISCSTTTVSGGIVSASTTSCPSSSNKQREEMVVPLYGSFDAQIEQHDDIWTSALAAPPVGHHHVDEQDNDLRYISNMMTKNGPPHEYSHHDHDTNGPEPESYEQQQHQPLDHLAINTGATSMEGYTMLQQQHRQKQHMLMHQPRHPQQHSPQPSSSSFYPHHSEQQNATINQNLLSAPPSQNYQQHSWRGNYNFPPPPASAVGAFQNTTSNFPSVAPHHHQPSLSSHSYGWPQSQAYNVANNQQHHPTSTSNGVYPLTMGAPMHQIHSRNAALYRSNGVPYAMNGFQDDQNVYQSNFFSSAQMGASSSSMPAIGVLQHGGLEQHSLIMSQSPLIGINGGGGDLQPKKKDKDKKRKYVKVADDEPRRPLSAYNFFFSEEKEIVVALLPELPKERSDVESSCDEIQVCDMSVDDVQIFLVEAKQKLSPDALATIREKIKSQTETTLLAHLEGDKVKKSHKKSHGKISFQKLAGVIGKRWRELSNDDRKRYYELAKTDQERFKLQQQVLEGKAGGLRSE